MTVYPFSWTVGVGIFKCTLTATHKTSSELKTQNFQIDKPLKQLFSEDLY